MRVNQPQWGNQKHNNISNPNMARPQQSQQNRSHQNSMPKPQSNSAHSFSNDTAAMQLARKIKTEQGDKAAGYFLYAIRPFVAHHEITHMELILNVKAERDPRESEHKNNQPNGFNMMQLLLNMMRGGKTDPMSIMRMMNNNNMGKASSK